MRLPPPAWRRQGGLTPGRRAPHRQIVIIAQSRQHSARLSRRVGRPAPAPAHPRWPKASRPPRTSDQSCCSAARRSSRWRPPRRKRATPRCAAERPCPGDSATQIRRCVIGGAQGAAGPPTTPPPPLADRTACPSCLQASAAGQGHGSSCTAAATLPGSSSAHRIPGGGQGCAGGRGALLLYRSVHALVLCVCPRGASTGTAAVAAAPCRAAQGGSLAQHSQRMSDRQTPCLPPGHRRRRPLRRAARPRA